MVVVAAVPLPVVFALRSRISRLALVYHPRLSADACKPIRAVTMVPNLADAEMTLDTKVAAIEAATEATGVSAAAVGDGAVAVTSTATAEMADVTIAATRARRTTMSLS